MLYRLLRACCLFLCTMSMLLLLPGTASAQSLHTSASDMGAATSSVPIVDPNYIYNRLFYMATHFLHREAGYDNNLPPQSNGHDEFAAYWSQEISRDLTGFGLQIRHDPFTIKGWQGRPATVPAFNVEASVPGVTHPEQVVIIGCHYDGMASSTQSAFDDASGCAIELGVAKAMGQYWRSQHVYPARTLRFVLFDAEEQGLFGSFHYVNSTINGDRSNIVAMINEEQNGIAYPLHYLGKLANPFIPFHMFMTPLQKNETYPNFPRLSALQQGNITQFRAAAQQALPAAFALFRALGYQNLTYHDTNGQDVAQPIFTPDQLKNVQQGDDTLGASDQYAFTLAGLPCLTMSGNFDPGPTGQPTPEHPGYPFDTQVDTIQLMNTYADGNSQQSQALTLALALPGMVTTQLLIRPDILGQTAADQNPIAAISDIGVTQMGQSLELDAKASFDPTNPNSALTYNWDFGDGKTADGVSVTHTYAATGTYTLTLTVSAPTGKRVVSKLITVTNAIATYANPYEQFQTDGDYRTDPAKQPQPNSKLSDNVTPHSLIPGKQASSPTATPAPPPHPLLSFIVAVGIIPVLLLIGALVFWSRKRRKRVSWE